MSDELRTTGVTLEREESGGAAPGKADLIREAEAAFSRGQYETYLRDLSKLVDYPGEDQEAAAEAALLLGHYYRGAYGGSYADSPNKERVQYYGERARALGRAVDGAGLIAIAELMKLGEMTFRRRFASLLDGRTDGTEGAFLKQGELTANWLLQAIRGDCLFAMKYLYYNVGGRADWFAGNNMGPYVDVGSGGAYARQKEKDNYLHWGLFYFAYRKLSQHPDVDPLLKMEAADRATLLLRKVRFFCKENDAKYESNKGICSWYVLASRKHAKHFEKQVAIAMEAAPQGEDKRLLSRIGDMLGMDEWGVRELMKENGYVPQPKKAAEQAAPVKTGGEKAAPAKKSPQSGAAAPNATGNPLKLVRKFYPFIAAALYIPLQRTLYGNLYASGHYAMAALFSYDITAGLIFAVGAVITRMCCSYSDRDIIPKRAVRAMVVYAVVWFILQFLILAAIEVCMEEGIEVDAEGCYRLFAAVLAGWCSRGVVRKTA